MRALGAQVAVMATALRQGADAIRPQEGACSKRVILVPWRKR
jgi:hypothetical protein